MKKQGGDKLYCYDDPDPDQDFGDYWCPVDFEYDSLFTQRSLQTTLDAIEIFR